MAFLGMSLPSLKAARYSLRVFGLFAIGIIVPSSFLSYLGLRSLRMENRIQREQTEQRYDAVADVLQHKSNDLAASLLDDVRDRLVRPALARGASSPHGSLLFSFPEISGAVVKAFVIIDRQGRVVFPPMEPPGRNDRVADPEPVNWGPIADDVHHLERLEFVDHNLVSSVAGYEALLPRAPNSGARIALLKAIASDDRQLKRWSEAEDRYAELIREDDLAPDPVGYAVGILARQLLADVYDAAADPDHALSTRLDLAQGLFEGRWPTTPRQQALFLTTLTPVIEKALEVDGPGIAEARTRWSRIRGISQRLDETREAATQLLRARGTEIQRHLEASGWRQGVILRDPQTASLIVIEPLSSLASPAQQAAIALLPSAAFFETVERSAADITQSSGLQILWNDQPFPHLMGPYLERSVALMDPPLVFRLLKNASDPQEILRRRRQSIYFGMIGLSFLVIVGGLVAMAQAVRREMEVAMLKSDFVATVSHELRTPLSAISYIGERLSLGRFTSSEQAQRLYDMLGEETGRLREMVDGILDFSKLLDGRALPVLRAHDLRDLAQEAQHRFAAKARSRGFHVAYEPPEHPVSVELDRSAALQALLNLLDNALKYSPDGKEIRLRVVRSEKAGGVAVQDFGLGIPPAEHKKVFEKFYRVEDSAQVTGERGVGLGLAMVQQIMENHHGRVDLASVLGQGSTFTLWFPRSMS